jgi:acyl-coenzyme A thioesterase PaaI-like protein
MGEEKSVQESYAPENRCFGCGPANDKGLHLRSFEDGSGGLAAKFTPEKHHEAFDGMLNGGIIGALLDCHCNWTAAMHLMRRAGAETPPCTVTAEYAVKLRRPTPSDQELELASKVVEATDHRAVVEAELRAGGAVCATCRGTFVAVKPGHPAYHRW